jgi:putative addiction module component (TIGR02574 family)
LPLLSFASVNSPQKSARKWTFSPLISIGIMSLEDLMTIEQTISQISQLPVEDQLRIIHAVWNQMGDETIAQPTQGQHKELDDRMARFRENPKSAMTEMELREKLRDSRS